MAAFFAVIVSGLRLVYQPGALVWHRYRPDFASLPGQAYGYEVGLGAYLASALTHHPASIGPALYRAPAGLAHALRTTSSRAAHPGNAWSRQLTRLQRRGLAFGPLAYGLSRWRNRGILRPYADREPSRGDDTC